MSETRQLLLDRAKWTYGWMSVEELSFLAEVASEFKENSIVYEIGSFLGKSTRAIADNAPESCKIYCVDPWEFEIPTLGETIKIDETTYAEFLRNLSNHIISGKITPVVSTWQDFIPEEKADFIFIDGDHSYDAVKHDILKALDYIKPNGIVAGHDYPNFDGVLKAVNECFPQGVFVKDTIWWIRKF